MNTEDMDYYEYEESKKRFTPKKIVKFIFSFIAAVVIISVFALIIGRITLIKIPKDFRGVTRTDTAGKLYDANEFDYITYPLGETYGPSSDMKSVIDPDSGKTVKITEGLYHVSNIALSEKAGEVQFTIRYNKRSTVNTLMENYKLTERPEGEVFVYRLRDTAGNIYTEYVFAEESNTMHEFRRVIFKNVDLTDIIPDINPAETVMEAIETEQDENTAKTEPPKLILEVFYGDDVAYNRIMNAEFTLYDSSKPYKELTADDFNGKDIKFRNAPYYEYKFEE